MQKRILIVDDDSDSRQIATHIVEMILQCKAYTVTDGLEAIRILNKESFDAVILDMRLPNIQGLDVARSLRMISRNQTIPVIAVTAFNLPWFYNLAQK